MTELKQIDYDIDKDNPVPFYYQIQKRIIEAIENSVWKPGELIPSERELSNSFKVSRITTRKALERLMIEGYIKKIKGRGATIAKPKIQEQLFNKVIGTFQDLKESGYEITNKILDFNIIVPGLEERIALNIVEGENVFNIKRLRFIDGEPYHYSDIFLPVKIYPDFKPGFLENESLINVLETKYGLKIYRLKRVFFPTIANVQEVNLFKIKIGSPMLTFSNTAFLKDSTPIEYTINIIRGDMSKFEINISLDKVEDISLPINK